MWMSVPELMCVETRGQQPMLSSTNLHLIFLRLDSLPELTSSARLDGRQVLGILCLWLQSVNNDVQTSWLVVLFIYSFFLF